MCVLGRLHACHGMLKSDLRKSGVGGEGTLNFLKFYFLWVGGNVLVCGEEKKAILPVGFVLVSLSTAHPPLSQTKS